MSTFLRATQFTKLAFRATPTARSTFIRSFSTYPSDRKYKSSHEWAKLDGDVATIGITDHAQAALGDIVHADLPAIGMEAATGEATAVVESVKAAVDIYAPIAGEIVGINDKLSDAPDLINSEPHEEGWIFQVKISDPAELESLMSSEEYEKSLAKEDSTEDAK